MVGAGAVMFFRKIHTVLENKYFKIVFGLMIVLLFVVIAGAQSKYLPAYPLSLRGLPTGVVSFLKKKSEGGRIYNVTNSGGYYEWELYPSHKIFMDMETAIFPEIDYFTSINGKYDPPTFEYILREYEPDYVVSSTNNNKFSELIAHYPQFRLVFFDDHEVLYANMETKRELVEKTPPVLFDPYAISDFSVDKTDRTVDSALDEALGMLSYSDSMIGLSSIACDLFVEKEEFAAAVKTADKIIRYYPNKGVGYAMKAYALLKKGEYAASIGLAETALNKIIHPVVARKVWKNLFSAYVKLEDYESAYAAMERAINPMSVGTTWEELVDYGLAAMAADHIREAKILLEMAQIKTPETEHQAHEKIDGALTLLTDAQGG